MTIDRFGSLPDGRDVHLIPLQAGPIHVEVLTYGGVLKSVSVPDRHGELRNVALGFSTLADYVERSPYFGAIIGRNANRIAGGVFTLDGTRYTLALNEPPNNLHGGVEGFDKKIWRIGRQDESSLVLHYVSPDGEEGFPGTVDAQVSYEVRDDGTLRVEYHATTDAPTIVNLTNHSYFNLGGEGSGSALDHVARIDADAYLPVGEDLIPTGEIRSVEGSEMDFRTPHTIGERIRTGSRQISLSLGYDHNFMLNRSTVEESGLAFAARFEDPVSGRSLEVWTTEPAVDFYTANFLDGSLVGPSGRTYRQGDAFAIEPEYPSNAPNTDGFGSTVLRPGETYRSVTEYRFSTASS